MDGVETVDGVYYLAVGDRVRVPNLGGRFRSGTGTVTAVRERSLRDYGSGASVSVAFKPCRCCGFQRDAVNEVDGTLAVPVRVRRNVPKEPSAMLPARSMWRSA